MHWFGGRRKKWTERDYMLALVLTKYEAGLCSCGQPMILAHEDDNDGWYSAHPLTCQSCAAQERASKPAPGAEPVPGRRYYTTYDRPADLPIGARRRRNRRASAPSTALPADAEANDQRNEPGEGDNGSE